MNKKAILLMFSAAFLALTACSNSGKKDGNSSSPAVEVSTKPIGARVYKLNCTLCHGNDGKLGANNSKDLTVSALTLEERVTQITKGKGTMAAYENILSKDEIQAVAEYTMTLK